MVSAAYVVRPGRCALGPLEGDVEEEELARKAAGEMPAPEELFVLELHRGERPRLRPTRSTDEIGICLEHWRQAIQGITEAVIALVGEADPDAAGELQARLQAERRLINGQPDAELTAVELERIKSAELDIWNWISALPDEDRPDLGPGAVRVLAWIRQLPLDQVQLVAAGRIGPPLEIAGDAQRLTGAELAVCAGELTARAIDVAERLESVIRITQEAHDARPPGARMPTPPPPPFRVPRRRRGFPMP